MTFSLIAMDRERRYMVVASATKTEAVGASVPAIAPGFGGVVSQAFTNTELRGWVLSSLESGVPLRRAVSEALAQDDEPELRQLAAMDSKGNYVLHTGSRCSKNVGEFAVENFVCVGNLLKDSEVIPKMGQAWKPALDSHALVQTSLACLLAAENAGGDARGRQSAAMLLARMRPKPELLLEIRIDNSEDPLSELERRLELWLASRVPSA